MALKWRYIAHMVIEVHVSGRSAKPRRALFAFIFLFVITCFLAAAMSWSRSSDILGPGIEPPDWSISFRPPKRFVGEVGLTGLGPAFQFQGRVGSKAVATLVVYRVESSGIPGAEDALGVCDRILRAHFGDQPPSALMAQTRYDVRIGPREAVEVWDPALDMLVRAVVVEPGDAYAVTFSIRDAPISPDTYSLFDQTCMAVQFRTR